MPSTKGIGKRRKPRGRPPAAPGPKLRLMTHAERVHALCGKFAYVRTSVDEFLARKHAEMEREDKE
jgi:hypothetical protein